jgi:hypothetical protein
MDNLCLPVEIENQFQFGIMPSTSTRCQGILPAWVRQNLPAGEHIASLVPFMNVGILRAAESRLMKYEAGVKRRISLYLKDDERETLSLVQGRFATAALVRSPGQNARTDE